MEERARRIVESASALAEEGGFEAVRLRDVAARSGVALGTLYSRFRSKEDLLVAALEQEMRRLEEAVAHVDAPGDTPTERVANLFQVLTRALTARPNFARAVLRSVASGVPESAEKVTRFHGRMLALLVCAIRGGTMQLDSPLTEEETELGGLLQEIWFAALVGWTGGQRSAEDVVTHMGMAARRLLS